MSLLQLGLEWTYVGVLKRSNWDLFWNAYYIEILLISCVSSCCNLWALIMDAGTGFTAQVYKLSTFFLHKVKYAVCLAVSLI